MAISHHTIGIMTDIASWIQIHEKEFELKAQQMDADADITDAALAIVKKYIHDNGLIVYGGLAIDYALRIKGTKLYPDNQRPDYDVYSPNSVDDSYSLADILHKAGFRDVGVVRGVHAQTMRVRTDFIYLADFGYSPPSVFEKIPYIEFDGIRVVHPDYQRMDMHIAFCFPFNSPPFEDIFHRWRKDVSRLEILDKSYPLVSADITPPNMKTITAILRQSIVGNNSISGFTAYAILRDHLDRIATTFGMVDYVKEIRAPKLSYSFPNNHTIITEIPDGSELLIISTNIEDIAPLNSIKYDAYVDLFPESMRSKHLIVGTSKRRLLASSLVYIESISSKVYVVTPSYLLVWLLYRSFTTEHRDLYRAYYNYTVEIIRTAEKIYSKSISDSTSEERKISLKAEYMSSPFAPTINTMGTTNISTSYAARMLASSKAIKKHLPDCMDIDDHLAKLLNDLPSGYNHIKIGRSHPAFDYDSNELFRRGGLPKL